MTVHRILGSGRLVSCTVEPPDTDPAFQMALRLFEGRATAEDLACRDTVINQLRARLADPVEHVQPDPPYDAEADLAGCFADATAALRQRYRAGAPLHPMFCPSREWGAK